MMMELPKGHATSLEGQPVRLDPESRRCEQRELQTEDVMKDRAGPQKSVRTTRKSALYTEGETQIE